MIHDYLSFRTSLRVLITFSSSKGIEALSLIRKDDSEARVIMVSAAGQREKMVDALKRGADDFVTKPFEEEKVIGTLKEVLKLK